MEACQDSDKIKDVVGNCCNAFFVDLLPLRVSRKGSPSNSWRWGTPNIHSKCYAYRFVMNLGRGNESSKSDFPAKYAQEPMPEARSQPSINTATGVTKELVITQPP